jgi:hypothetical protein
MLADSYNPTVQWLLSLNWNRHYRANAPYWVKNLLKTDILMSAMFLAYHKRDPSLETLVSVIGVPDWIEGTRRTGEVYYELYRIPGSLYRETMLFYVHHGRIVSGGTNNIFMFKLHSARRRPARR